MTTTIVIIGALGKDAESRMTPDGKPVLSISVGSSCGYGDKKSTLWVRVSCFGDRWSKIASWLKKGSKVAVTGQISRAPTTYIKDGVAMVNPIEITADQIHLIGGEKKEESPSVKQAAPQQQSQYATSDFNDSDCPF